MIQKSYEKNISNLYLIPTPIGNMKDITSRSIEILDSVDCIYAEDTRVSIQLLNSLNIKNKICACHKFNEKKVSIDIINKLSNGLNIAIITDRGTPLVSDPGYEVVKEVIQAGYNVISLPGACAFLPALCMSGLDTNHFLFYGFLNSKTNQALEELKTLNKCEYTIIIYEAPHRLIKTLENILKIMGNRKISISREISKIHEEVFRGSVEEALSIYKEPKGEIVIIIEGNKKTEESINYIKEIEDLKNYGMSPNNAIKYISKKYNISKNDLYKDYEENKK